MPTPVTSLTRAFAGALVLFSSHSRIGFTWPNITATNGTFMGLLGLGTRGEAPQAAVVRHPRRARLGGVNRRDHRRLWSSVATAVGLSTVALLSGPRAWAQSDESDSLIQEVTVEEIKSFIDPTLMRNSFDYDFATNFLSFDAEVYTHRVIPFWAINHWTGVWAELPIQTLSLPDAERTTGVGDVLLGWGAIIHEDLQSRLTTSIVTFEVLAPTGDPDRGTGFGTWILAPGGALAFNPTDSFPVFVVGRYLHSVEGLGGDGREEEVAERPDLRVRSAELTLQTVHILLKGFYVSVIPSFVFNFNQDFSFFSLGIEVGRALNSKLAVSGGYVRHLAGRQTFNQVLTFRVNFLFGRRKDE